MNRITLMSLVAFSVLTTACGAAPEELENGSTSTSPKQQLMGSWNAPRMTFTLEGRTHYSTMQLTFQSSRVIAENTCDFAGGNKVVVRTESAATITDSEITIHASSENGREQNGLTCTVSLGAGTVDYEVEGSALVLSVPGEGSSAFTRAD